MEVALVLVVRVEPGVCVRADEVAPGGGRLEQRDVIDVHAGRLGRIEDVRHVHEDGDVLAHLDSLIWSMRPPARSRCSAVDAVDHAAARPCRPDRGHPALRARTGFDEPVTLQAGPLRRIVGQGRLDDAAALVARRSEDLLQERVGHAVRVVVGIDHDEVDGADEAAGRDGRPEGEDRTSDDLAPGFGDEDARLREVDQLSEQVPRASSGPARGRRTGPPLEGDEPFDVRDASRSDQVFHAGGGTSCEMAEAIWFAPRRSGADRRHRRSAAPRGVASRGLDSHARVAPTGVAFGPPML